MKWTEIEPRIRAYEERKHRPTVVMWAACGLAALVATVGFLLNALETLVIVVMVIVFAGVGLTWYAILADGVECPGCRGMIRHAYGGYFRASKLDLLRSTHRCPLCGSSFED